MQKSQTPIFYLELEIEFKKNKSFIPKAVYCITHSEVPSDIFKDQRSIDIINSQCYPKTHKSEKEFRIKKLTKKVFLGYQSSHAS